MATEIDARLEYGAQGLGLMNETISGKFYPIDAIEKGGFIEDEWLGRPIRVERGAVDGVPFAVYLDGDGERPMQLLSRWYGFSFTFPNCEIYQP